MVSRQLSKVILSNSPYSVNISFVVKITTMLMISSCDNLKSVIYIIYGKDEEKYDESLD